jgi:hypothetical protein
MCIGSSYGSLWVRRGPPSILPIYGGASVVRRGWGGSCQLPAARLCSPQRSAGGLLDCALAAGGARQPGCPAATSQAATGCSWLPSSVRFSPQHSTAVSEAASCLLPAPACCCLGGPQAPIQSAVPAKSPAACSRCLMPGWPRMAPTTAAAGAGRSPGRAGCTSL